MFVRELRAFSIRGPARGSMLCASDLLAEQPHISEVVTGTVPLERVHEAFEAPANGGGGAKVLVERCA